jgi:hypothetical protein
MPLLTELENPFVRVLQRCRTYGAVGGDALIPDMKNKKLLRRL